MPNYIRNRGTEGAVYLRYIVDHYHDFPDFGIFVHPNPEHHQKNWLEMLNCIRPNATYVNINIGKNYYRTTHFFQSYEIWLEQCFRDVLKIVWNLKHPENLTEFHRLTPLYKPVTMRFTCCQQFILSRQNVHKRPLSVWKVFFLFFDFFFQI
jgi:hypothetical protein